MSQVCVKRTHDITIRRLPSIRSGITLIWLERISSLSRESDEIVGHLHALHDCHIVRYTSVSKCLKYLKQVKSYERIVVIMSIDNCSITTSDISRFCQYRQIESIFIVALINGKDNNVGIDISGNIRDEIGKIDEIFHDYQSLFNRLQQLMNQVDESDDDFFVFINRSGKSFRHLSNELGSYI